MKQIQVINQADNKSFTWYDNANGTILRAFEGFEYSSVRDVIEDISGQQSSIYLTSKFGRRRISWSGDLISDNVFTLRRQMSAALRQQGVLKLIKFTTYDDLELQCEAEIVKVINPYNHKIHTFLIEAIAPDWRFYSQSLTELEIDVTAGENVPTGGDERTDPVFIINGPGTVFTVTNNTNNGSFVITTETITASDFIRVDVANRLVLLNGITSLYADFAGDFFSLEPGDNDIVFEATDDDGDTSLEIQFRDAYLGL